MKNLLFIGFASVMMLLSCSEKKDNSHEKKAILPLIKTGIWRGTLTPQSVEMPFMIDVKEHNGKYTFFLINADERIPLDEVVIDGDSIHVPLFVFDATIHAKVEGDEMTGVWVKNYIEGYGLPFKAVFGQSERFVTQQEPEADFGGKWEVDFINEDGSDKAIGLFEQSGRKLTGTFLTPTGDYRFLEGVVDGITMKLSCFDGVHAFLFEATMKEDGSIEGDFWSGKSWHQKWKARRNEDFELPDPYSLTYIKEGYEKFAFKFPNMEGDLVELSDLRYQGKVVVVQILGTWCPNCMDETAFLADWYKRNKERGVEIIGLDFETKDDMDYAIRRVNRMKDKIGVTYEILFAGSTDKESVAKALPMLNHVMSFPTTIILDKNHKVRRIHTGFSGPGTGEYYEKYIEEFNLLMDKLLLE